MLLPKLETLPMEQMEKILLLRNQQQSKIEIDNYRQNSKCYVCGSTKNLVIHHIKYWPPQEIIICRICHLLIHEKTKRNYYVTSTTIPDRVYYNSLKKQPREEQDRIIKNAVACKWGKCEDCWYNCAIRELKIDRIKDKIYENKRRWVNAKILK